MDERFDNRSESDGGPTTPHLTPEQITAYLDGDLTPAERAGLDAHLRTCPACRREMSDVRSTVLLLRGLPDYRPRRSFQLIPGRAAIRRPWWERVGLKILPALPALRAATVAVAILLAVVSAGQVIRDRNGNESPNEQPAMLSATTVAPTSQPVGAAASTATTGTAPTRTSGPVQQAKATQEPTESLQANAAPREEQEPTEAPAAAGGGIGGGAESAPPEPTSDTSSADESTGGDGAAESAPADDAEAASQGAAASAAEATESDTDEGDTDSVGNGEDTQSIDGRGGGRNDDRRGNNHRRGWPERLKQRRDRRHACRAGGDATAANPDNDTDRDPGNADSATCNSFSGCHCRDASGESGAGRARPETAGERRRQRRFRVADRADRAARVAPLARRHRGRTATDTRSPVVVRGAGNSFRQCNVCSSRNARDRTRSVRGAG